MTSHPLHDIVRRLRENVRRELPDQCADVMRVPASSYRDAAQFERELAEIFLKAPLLVALSCDVPQPGDYTTLALAGRPVLVMRGDDRRVRAFLNVCRHRGARVATAECGSARRLVCPYHAWSYDRSGKLAGVAGRESFGEIDATGLVELPCEERVGAVFAALTPGAAFDLSAWLGGMETALAAIELERFFPYRKPTRIETPNWKLSADGYLDGYHIGYLHRASIGAKSITNVNTYDLFGPHVRIGFATQRTAEIDDTPESAWRLPDLMSLVHYLFPNVSLSGGHGDTLMLSRLHPGPTVERSLTIQQQYFREPVEGELLRRAEEKRVTYERVVRDEDAATIFGIDEALPALGDEPILFGRNEPANQRLHQTIRAMTAKRT
jgi:phenylpropionate dioxygenase-like ring-hydroxylating dioxygenase large terminal subunit